MSDETTAVATKSVQIPMVRAVWAEVEKRIAEDPALVARIVASLPSTDVIEYLRESVILDIMLRENKNLLQEVLRPVVPKIKNLYDPNEPFTQPFPTVKLTSSVAVSGSDS